jgi:ribonuclease inhibitor
MFRRERDELEIDVSSVLTRAELHELLAQAFGFPDYYGKNWDAFDECIREVGIPGRVRIVGMQPLRERLPREATLLMACLQTCMEGELGATVRWNVS